MDEKGYRKSSRADNRGAIMRDWTIVRKPSIIQEEIDDLRRYLRALPEQFRTGWAFNSYERRIIELSKELRESVNQTLSTASVP
jgi:hypothetical protein